MLTRHVDGDRLVRRARRNALREAELVENAVEELLRLDSSHRVQIAPRVALELIEVEGTQLDPEMVIALVLGSANRDPRRYERPDERAGIRSRFRSAVTRTIASVRGS